MAWSTPKEDWAQDDVVAASDFNRIESNTSYLKTAIDGLGTITEGTFDATFAGGADPNHIFTVAQTKSIKYRLWVSLTSGYPKQVTLFFPKMVATSNSTNLYAINCLPGILKPSASDEYITIPINVINNGVIVPGGVRIQVFNSAIDFPLVKNELLHIVSTPVDICPKITSDDSAPTGPETGYTASGDKGFPAFVITYPIWP